ncbi:MAG: efflux RND transporter permease subunit [Candidatus Marinimicrobia bacterium]|jgi:multidrug efflux pump subunit AcrB|nr:efflux RND transporter permease subunit [Candidatus Neomarinimicrobiota bacterium]MBT4362735.1 efflux RND transporter permease subunit [Candidatus Neomarinimicrobiota bacterium]MBT4713145.1 efflux RND transporter permease subunit [Candidatus Neomarinimicrobiota bacterium]MBT4945867.1 efflux RND transporter permease subunit [Candidatus Neomarinimicrobiota bacterium]MBT5270490.1 efflux RND transporter permease subunit [Candidatus Neomarinimicrobiota bacterium]
MKSIIQYFIKYSTTGNVLILLILFLGWFGFSSLRSTLIPKIDPGVVNISTVYPGASPEEVEQGVVLKIEQSLQGVTGIKKLTSISRENMGVVTAELTSGVNPDIVLQDIKNSVDGISSFPSGIEPPRASKWEFRSEAIDFMINGDVDLKLIKQEALMIEDDLLAITGISKIEISGFPEEEIEIAFRETDLETYGITLAQAVSVVKAANIDLTGGNIRGESEDLSIRTRQKQYYADDLKAIVLRSQSNGVVLRLEDVADVTDKWAENPNAVYVDGKPAALIKVKYTSEEDIIFVASTVENYVIQFNLENDVLEAKVLANQADTVRSMQAILANNGIVGFFLVLLFLSLALNPRMAFWVALSIPLSFMGMFALAALFDVTLNKISMFGMILVVGILVDDGIVIAENIYQHHEKGKRRIRAAIDGALEVLPAVTSAIITTIIAFSAFMLIEGTFGQFFKEMAFVVMAALFVSLIEGALILPAHIAHSKALAADRNPSWLEKKSTYYLAKMRDNWYAPVYKKALENRLITLAAVTGVFVITIGAAIGGVIQMGGSNFENQNHSDVSLQMPPGTPESKTHEMLLLLEERALEVGRKFSEEEGKEVITSIINQQSSADEGGISVNFVDSREREFLSTDFSNAWRQAVGPLPEVDRLNYVEATHFGKAVSISLLGDDVALLERAVEDFKTELENLSGLKNVIDDNQQGMREVEVVLKDHAHLLGLNIQTVMSQVRNGFYGAEVQRINRGTEEIKIWVRYAKTDRSSIGDLELMRIRTASGQTFQLKDIANLHYTTSLSTIRHLNGQRQVKVEADALNKSIDLGQIKSEVTSVILPGILKKYPGVNYSIGGREERMAEAAGSMKKILPAIGVLLFAVIAFTFRSFGQTAILFMLIPLGFIGIGWGHAIHNTPIDMPSYFGVVALIGVLVNDSIVFIGTLNRRLKKGMAYMDALFEAGLSRFRPILLTSMTTIAGLMPLIIANNPDAQQTVPMAISVAYGLIISTFSTLVILPVLLSLFNGVQRHYRKWRTGVMPTAEEIESSVKELDIDAQFAEGNEVLS